MRHIVVARNIVNAKNFIEDFINLYLDDAIIKPSN